MKLRPLYICYRSFNPQLERTKDFAEMGVKLKEHCPYARLFTLSCVFHDL